MNSGEVSLAYAAGTCMVIYNQGHYESGIYECTGVTEMTVKVYNNSDDCTGEITKSSSISSDSGYIVKCDSVNDCSIYATSYSFDNVNDCSGEANSWTNFAFVDSYCYHSDSYSFKMTCNSGNVTLYNYSDSVDCSGIAQELTAFDVNGKENCETGDEKSLYAILDCYEFSESVANRIGNIGLVYKGLLTLALVSLNLTSQV